MGSAARSIGSATPSSGSAPQLIGSATPSDWVDNENEWVRNENDGGARENDRVRDAICLHPDEIHGDGKEDCRVTDESDGLREEDGLNGNEGGRDMTEAGRCRKPDRFIR